MTSNKQAFSALSVITKDPKIRAYLEKNDPNALRQAEEAAAELKEDLAAGDLRRELDRLLEEEGATATTVPAVGETFKSHGVSYRVIQVHTPETADEQGLSSLASHMRENRVAFQAGLQRPRGRRVYAVVVFEDGTNRKPFPLDAAMPVSNARSLAQ